MTESQSRYGIMEELNTKKLQTKNELTNLEAQTEQAKAQRIERIDGLKNQVLSLEGTYKLNHQQWKVKRLSDLRLKTKEFEIAKANIEDEIEEKDATYESDFQTWKVNTQADIATLSNELEKYSKIQSRMIAAKKEILTEIDSGINNLKEMSKEQKEK